MDGAPTLRSKFNFGLPKALLVSVCPQTPFPTANRQDNNNPAKSQGLLINKLCFFSSIGWLLRLRKVGVSG
jgi:hypothetical protein